jgi:hypothetical protein
MTEDKILMNKELQRAQDYWYKEWGRMGKQIDTLCVRSAERLNDIRYKLVQTSSILTASPLAIEQRELENILRHFHGKLDEEYIRGHNLGPDKYWED